MVPSVDDIRRAVYQTLSEPDPYEVIDGRGIPLNISSADELSIGSMDLSLRKASTVSSTGTETSTTPEPGGATDQPSTTGSGPGVDRGGHTTETPGDQTSTTPEYHRYQLDRPTVASPTTTSGEPSPTSCKQYLMPLTPRSAATSNSWTSN